MGASTEVPYPSSSACPHDRTPYHLNKTIKLSRVSYSFHIFKSSEISVLIPVRLFAPLHCNLWLGLPLSARVVSSTWYVPLLCTHYQCTILIMFLDTLINPTKITVGRAFQFGYRNHFGGQRIDCARLYGCGVLSGMERLLYIRLSAVLLL